MTKLKFCTLIVLLTERTFSRTIGRDENPYEPKRISRHVPLFERFLTELRPSDKITVSVMNYFEKNAKLTFFGSVSSHGVNKFSFVFRFLNNFLQWKKILKDFRADNNF
jgi:hypothetical protein